MSPPDGIQFIGSVTDSSIVARMNGTPIAYVHLSPREGNTVIHIEDICIYKGREVRKKSAVARFLAKWIPPFKYRIAGKQGIGTELMKYLIRQAEKEGFKEIRGSVVQQGIDDYPNLLGWYERFGFQVRELPKGSGLIGEYEIRLVL